MKKLLVAISIMALSSSLHAACFGPFCYDDSGMSIGGLYIDGNGTTVPSQTSAVINANSPKAKGIQVFCSDCVGFMASKGLLCYSTGTAAGAYVALSSAAAVTACK